MPTTKPRHAITETAAVAHALDVARRRWPGQPPTRLLTRLIEAGTLVVEQEEADERARHRRALEELTALAQHYPEGYLGDVRTGWPE
ncbi:hypothetical protein Xcel_1017 [Xylanimonas cellulosilytica DSM 15894]|uniref:Uncharacterized protein n=1 Tax=Xylanimonas cellulosilytica (strain DSM 15894 / JCM 12276 / CECT 5975 / KCTC 9989 / LMG 20990 / NBRC 107835 / XIL07) TaxID=446471 RepID=D1BYX3_XYLCX|nr:hypothetical protein [Xylanimonas cellulosilytica]ACZ30048.1 hypothetical protein Xcel_1017 [Xylanimonas cellulosilytica DSM 15894]